MSYTHWLPVLTLFCVFLSVAIRQAWAVRLKIWQIMLAGAAVVVLSGSITPVDALRSIDLDVMLFLLGMFIVGEALVKSGYLYHVSYGLFRRAGTPGRLVIYVLIVMGAFSALLMNDTIAIIGTPLVLYLSRKHGIPAKLMLLALCFAVTTGSAASPIGNPQNLLIALWGKGNQFLLFFKYLALPTVINLGLAYLVLRFFYREHLTAEPLEDSKDYILDHGLSRLCRASLVIVCAMIALKAAAAFYPPMDFRLTYVALVPALPLLFLSPRRFEILKDIDWATLVFFASLFVVVASVWGSGVIQAFLTGIKADMGSSGLILVLSVILSQILSNVPFVALYLPVLGTNGGAAGAMALAAGSTMAGNLLILGAASNVIVIQNAEKNGETLGFFEFARAGVPLTLMNIAVYWAYFRLLG